LLATIGVEVKTSVGYYNARIPPSAPQVRVVLDEPNSLRFQVDNKVLALYTRDRDVRYWIGEVDVFKNDHARIQGSIQGWLVNTEDRIFLDSAELDPPTAAQKIVSHFLKG
jgi:hypothetical protein